MAAPARPSILQLCTDILNQDTIRIPQGHSSSLVLPAGSYAGRLFVAAPPLRSIRPIAVAWIITVAILHPNFQAKHVALYPCLYFSTACTCSAIFNRQVKLQAAAQPACVLVVPTSSVIPRMQDLQVISSEPGRVLCSLGVKPQLQNRYGTLHGGAIGACCVSLLLLTWWPQGLRLLNGFQTGFNCSRVMLR